MKNTKLLIVLLFIILQSCSSTFYQVYKVEAEKMQNDRDAIVYNDENCSVIYNLWSERGDLSFIFTNKTDNDIHIDLTRSFFISNGLAHDYYEDKAYAESHSIGFSSTTSVMSSYTSYMTRSNMYGVDKLGYTHTPYMWTPTVVSRATGITKGRTETIKTNSSFGKRESFSSSVTTYPAKSVCVPAHSSKVVKGFVVSDYVYIDCDDNKFNKPKGKSRTITYTKENSPLIFRNRIVYKIGNNDFIIDNGFYVRELVNYSKSEFYTKGRAKVCGQKRHKEEIFNKVYGANMFYNTYGGAKYSVK